MRLAVELYGILIGYLDGTDSRTFDFRTRDDAAEAFGVNSRVLSVVMPVSAAPPRQYAGRRRNWFAELLPEGDQREYMLAEAGIRRGDVLAFLARYGRDVAGALQIWDVDDPSEPKTPELRPLDATRIRALLEDPIGSPLGNAPGAGKSSLGGVQPKIVLARVGDEWNQVVGGFPSTHILKPQLERKPTVIFDEEFGARLARRTGLADFDTHIEDFAGLSTLVIERFDRAEGERVHQEDFNQALGAAGNQKYQEVGGVVSLHRVAQTLSRFATTQDVNTLARMVILAVATGNLDLHTKNLGLLHPSSGVVTIAPAYDVVPMAHHPDADGKLALAVNKKYRRAELSAADLETELRTWGVRRPHSLVEDSLEELRAATRAESPLAGAHPGVQDDILSSIENLLDGRAIGAA